MRDRNLDVLVRSIGLRFQTVEQRGMEELPPIAVGYFARTNWRRRSWFLKGRGGRHRRFMVGGSNHASGKKQGEGSGCRRYSMSITNATQSTLLHRRFLTLVPAGSGLNGNLHSIDEVVRWAGNDGI